MNLQRKLPEGTEVYTSPSYIYEFFLKKRQKKREKSLKSVIFFGFGRSAVMMSCDGKTDCHYNPVSLL